MLMFILLLFIKLELFALTSSATQCLPKLIDTLAEFEHLDFQVPNKSGFWAWDDLMEQRYKKNLETWESNPLNVYLIPFSHVDAFWLSTFEDYYSTKVSRILDNVVTSMVQFPGMKFVWSDVAFLQHWWDRAGADQKTIFKNLVLSGRLEIVTGGWVMPDEATTSLHGLFSVLVEGHEWLQKNLNVFPVTSWSLDPFGVGPTWPALLAASGVKGGHLIQRIHWAWKLYFGHLGRSDFAWMTTNISDEAKARKTCFEQRGPDSCLENQATEAMNSKTSYKNLSDQSVTQGDSCIKRGTQDSVKLRVQHSATYVMGDSCGPCVPLCRYFDFADSSNGITFTNVRRQAEILLGQYGRLGSLSKGNKAVVLLGGDFRFSEASEWRKQYSNYNALMDYIHSNYQQYKAHIKFATLNDYFSQVEEPDNVLQGDFFPYSDYSLYCTPSEKAKKLKCQSNVDYWTGYFTTRPYLKLLSNTVGYRLRAIEILLAFGPSHSLMEDGFQEVLRRKLIWTRRVYAMFQHHDGITGTSTNKVMMQQAERLTKAQRHLDDLIGQLVSGFVDSFLSAKKPPKKPKAAENFHYGGHQKLTINAYRIVLFNSIESASNNLHVIPSPMNVGSFKLSDGAQSQEIQVVCTESDQFVWFRTPVPPMSLKILHLTETERKPACQCSTQETRNNFTMSNNKVNLFFVDGSLDSFTETGDCPIELRIKLATLNTKNHTNGAYVFKTSEQPVYLAPSDRRLGRNGTLFQEIITNFDCANISIKIFNENEIPSISVTVEFLLTDNDKELLLEVHSSIQNNKWFTDVNDFELRERKRNGKLGPEANVYPMTVLTYIEDDDYRLALVSDHSHGVANPKHGVLQVMLDRRTSTHDAKGMEEPLKDNVRSVSRFLLIPYNINRSKIDILEVARQFGHTPLILKINILKATHGTRSTRIPSRKVIKERKIVEHYKERHLVGGKTISFSREVFTHMKSTSSPECNFSSSDATMRLIGGADMTRGVRIVASRILLGRNYGPSGSWVLVVFYNTNSYAVNLYNAEVKFGFVRLVTITETSLTGIEDGEDVASLSEIVIKPHAFKSVKLFLKHDLPLFEFSKTVE